MRILFVGQNLQQGGVQIALVNTLKELVKQQHTIDLFLFGTGAYTTEIPSGVNVYLGTKSLQLVATPYRKLAQNKMSLDYWHRLGLMAAVRIKHPYKLYADLFKRQKTLGFYDVAISYFTDVPHDYFNQGTNQYVADFVDAGQKIAWIHNDPFEGGFEVEHCRRVYGKSDQIVCVSEACAMKFRQFLPEYADRVQTVYNLFPLEEILEKAQHVSSERLNPSAVPLVKLVTVARIDNYQKRLDRILEVGKKLIENEVTNFRWEIIGEGPDLKSNREQIASAGLEKFIIYRGSQLNPYPTIAQSDLFVLTSQYEGYPMVVNEALILGVPVLTTPYAAAHEQIEAGLNGIVTKMSTEQLYLEIRKLLENPGKIQQFKQYIQQHPIDNRRALKQLDSVLTSREISSI